MSALKIHIRHLCKAFMLLSLVFFIAGCTTSADVREKVINDINSKCVNSACQITLKDIIDFKWDKIIIFQVGSSSAEISKTAGVEYKGKTDLMSGMLFLLDNKIVHEEKVPYDPEQPSKLQFTIEKAPKDPNCIMFTADEAVVIGSKVQIDGKNYYQVIASSVNKKS
ncbi:hypothetical protein [Paenibacillus koleovorans]|uniref:hypothetical protein n=1 Tax=Paenibacillus koleovorans TaxID=121608 RepID=UPI000FDC35C8|nr:hypothetical protein [Paenibacillus koleovorans]